MNPTDADIPPSPEGDEEHKRRVHDPVRVKYVAAAIRAYLEALEFESSHFSVSRDSDEVMALIEVTSMLMYAVGELWCHSDHTVDELVALAESEWGKL